jgi:hypothetical protein
MLVMANTRTGEVRDYFARLVPVHEREIYGQQLIAGDVDGPDPIEWVYVRTERARPPRPLTT